jgi:hypothetical protein
MDAGYQRALEATSWERAVQRSLREIEKRRTQDLQGLLSELRRIRAELLGEIALASGAHRTDLRALRRTITELMTDLSEELNSRWSEAWEEAWAAGLAAVLVPATARGLGAVAVSEVMLDRWRRLIPETIRATVAEAAQKLARAASTSILAGNPPSELSEQLTKTLGTGRKRGGLGTRLEGLYTDQTHRLHSMAHHEASQQLDRRMEQREKPDRIVKIWQHIPPVPTRQERPHHVRMHGTALPMSGVFRGGLRYPRDPRADISETAHCLCYLLTMPESEATRQGYRVEG